MSQTTLLTREPVVNKNRAITANRLIAHGAIQKFLTYQYQYSKNSSYTTLPY